MNKNNGHVYISFPFYSKENGDVIVEVCAWYQKPDFNNTSSDWDFYGGFTIDDVKVYQDNVLMTNDIPYSIIEENLKEYVRNLDIQDSWENERNICY